MPNERLTNLNIVLAILLTVFAPIIGIVYLLWMFFGKKGLYAGFGCLLLPFALILLWLSASCYSNAHPEFGEHVDHVSWLPDGATDASYYQSYSFTAAEFKISENDFKNNTNSSWVFTEIVKPETIERYNYFPESDRYYKSHPDFDSKAYDEFQKRINATVTNGIVAQKRQSNGGGYHAVYDRDTGIGYIQTNPR